MGHVGPAKPSKTVSFTYETTSLLTRQIQLREWEASISRERIELTLRGRIGIDSREQEKEHDNGSHDNLSSA